MIYFSNLPSLSTSSMIVCYYVFLYDKELLDKKILVLVRVIFSSCYYHFFIDIHLQSECLASESIYNINQINIRFEYELQKKILWLRSFERRFVFININIYERYLFKRRRLICIIILFQSMKENKNVFFFFEYVYLKKKNDFFFIYSLLQSNQIFFFFILI